MPFRSPEGAEIVQVQMLSRHGSRYPTSGSDVVRFGEKVANESATASFKGSLSFMNDWEYLMGKEILVSKGRQELFDSGTCWSRKNLLRWQSNQTLQEFCIAICMGACIIPRARLLFGRP